MKTKILIAALALATAAAAAHAEMVDIGTSADGMTTLRGKVGSIVASKSGATGIFGMTFRDYKGGPVTSTQNGRMTVSAKTCNDGAGNVVMTTLAGGRIGTYEWVSGDGSLADTVAQVMCLVFHDPKGTRT